MTHQPAAVPGPTAEAPADRPTPALPGEPLPFEPAPPILGPGAIAAAGVDVGANSVHLLVAVVSGHRLEPVVDESVFLGLGDRVDAAGTLGPAKRAELVAALERYAALARRLGADRVTFVGTEPLRRAADAATAVHDVERATGAPLCVLDPREEAELTLLGVSLGRPITRELAIVDVGGGSTQLVRGGPGHAPQTIGLRLGVARLTAAFVNHDPPLSDEINAMRAEVHRTVAARPAVDLAELIAVGGTASNLVKVLPAALLDRRLDPERLLAALADLSSEPAALVAERHLINPTRARLLPAGAVVLEAILAHFGLDGLSVSESGVREGLVLATAHAGRAWRDQLAVLAQGWDAGATDSP